MNAIRIVSGSAGLVALAATVHAASLDVDFQATIASEQHPAYGGEARYYHVSVNPANPGTGSYAATIVGTNNPAPTFVRNFTDPVVGYKFAGGANNDITAVAQSGGEDTRIVFSTTDTSFDGFGQSQAKIWTVTDPGADIQTTIADPFNAVDDVGGTGGWRSLGGAIGTVDVSGLASGSVHVYYGAFSAKPSLSAILRDLDGGAPDIVVADAHLNDDTANRTEYYLAELDFVTDGVYDQVIFTWDSDGDGDLATGNGRGIATVLTGTTGVAPLLAVTNPVDDAVDVPVNQNLVATFNKDIQAGTGNITIKNLTDVTQVVIPIGDAQVSISGDELTIDPTADLEAGDSYAIQIDTGAVTDLATNAFAGIADDTTWNFSTVAPDTTAPTLDSITDDAGSGTIFDTSTVTYTVTFSEAMNASTIEISDFGNAASATAGISVDSVSATGDPAVFEVVVSPTSTGTIQIQVNASAELRDVAGNLLDTSSAILDDTVINVVPFTTNNGSLEVDFQATIASEQHPDYAGEARYYHVSVNPANPGTGSYAATIVGTNDPAPPFVRNFDGEVVSYKFAGGVNNDITAVAQEGGDTSRISFSTTDTTFDGFGQQQAKIWTVTDPGADIQTTIADPFNAVDDVGGTGGWRSLGGAIGTVDVSGLASGSVHVYYGAFSAKPSLSAILRDTDGPAPDIVLADAHLNDDTANRTEYYLAELDFVTDGIYDEVVFTWDSDGDGNLATGNGRGIAAVLTGPAVLDDYTAWAEQFAPADLTDQNADLDGDGLTNNDERLFGLDPTDPSSQNPYAVPLDSGAGTFSFTRRDNALTGLFTDIETSTDLQNWTVDSGAVLVEGAVDGNGVETVSVTLSAALLSNPKLFVRVNQNEGVVYSEDFESNAGGYTATGTPNDWAYGTPNSNNDFNLVVSGGNNGSTGAWGTSLGDGSIPSGLINTTANSLLRSPDIDLSGITGAELDFAAAVDAQTGDAVQVIVRNAGDDTALATIDIVDTSGAPVTADWTDYGPFDISAGAGSTVYLEFRFAGSDAAFIGLYVDDIVVTQTP